jgi:Heterokaryon incompatibility protein (HET)
MSIPKTLRSSSNSGFLDSSHSDPNNSWCQPCKRIPLTQIFCPSRLQRQKRYKISHPNTPGCPMCLFVRQLEQLDSQSSDDQVGDNSTGAFSLLLSTFDTTEPWWHVLGLTTSRPAPPFAWFQREGSAPASKSERPLVLVTYISTENVTSALDISVPRRRPEAEQHQGVIDLEVLKSWLQTCDQNHGATCRIEANRFRKPRNLRLIDIRSRDIIGSDTDARYVALSYVWGSRSRTSHGHLPSNPSTSDLSGLAEVSKLRRVPCGLPATFEDAITVCKALGEQFLWIDLFCIDQTNSHELQDQINQMNTIYQSAAFTIIARDFDAYGGLPGISRPLRKRHQPALSTPHGELLGTHIRPAVALSGKSPWDLRGWTLQESLFSHRRLMFSIHTVRLICQQEYFHDNLVNTMCSRHPVTLMNRFDWWDSANSIDLRLSCWDFKTFNALISVYTYRILRYPGDILNACRGALLELESRTSASFSYGIPTTDAHRALLWSSHSSHTLSRRPGRWPSWSWCGWLGRVAWREWIVDMLNYEGEANVHDPHVSILNRKKHKRRRVDDDHSLNSTKMASTILSNDSTLSETIWPALLRFPEIEDHTTLAILRVSSLIAP